MHTIPAIIEQHAEEAASCWLLRDAVVTEPHYDIVDLTQLDDRVEANIDGLRIAEDAGWEICREAMAIGEPGEIFTAGILAFESQIPRRMDDLLGAVVGNAELQRALCSALGWIAFHQVAGPANKLLDADLAYLKRIALSAHAIHREDIGPGLATYIPDVDPRVRSRSLKAVGELGRTDLLPLVLNYADDEDERCRFYAVWSAALLGDNTGIGRLISFVDAQSDYAQRACDLAVRKMDHADAVQWLNALGTNASSIRLAINGYGALGDPQAVPWLIEMMKVAELARPAGEAFSMITGVDMAYEDLEGDEPEGFEAGPTEEPEDEDVDMDPDEDLPWPDPGLIYAWWQEHKKRFSAGKRYFVGAPVSSENCKQVLINGFQRQRAAAALELAVMNPGNPLFETRAPGYRQQMLLGIKK
jgi:uncharacterized protein (TIGR02270 family)